MWEGGGQNEKGLKFKIDVNNRVIRRFRVFLVYRFRFYKKNDILTNNWGGGKKESGKKLKIDVKNRVICRFRVFWA